MKTFSTYLESVFDVDNTATLHIGEKINKEIEVDKIENGTIFFKKSGGTGFYYAILSEEDLNNIIQLCRDTDCKEAKFNRAQVRFKINKELDFRGLKISSGGNIVLEFDGKSGVVKNGILETSNDLEIIVEDSPVQTDFSKFKLENVQAKGDCLKYNEYPFISIDSKSNITVRQVNIGIYLYSSYNPIIDQLRNIREEDEVKDTFRENRFNSINAKEYVVYDYKSGYNNKAIVFGRRGSKITRKF